MEKKSLEQLISERNTHRKLWGKVFTHDKSGQKYQLLRTAHDTETQNLCAVFSLVAMPSFVYITEMESWLKKHSIVET